MRRAAAGNRGLDEVVDRVARGFLAVVRDNRRILVKITEVEPATTELPDVLFVGAFSDARRTASPSGPSSSKLWGSELPSDSRVKDVLMA
jgi:hypothetical protein